ncbi:hypothetical protein [Peteryoungia ipomoeae]|uniref:Uncharacterized protein n=1 Tax=Peteryoungia ipomoeae TaxID=1210932 RepID=A0A4S8NUS4_9HYPH|nr:hypothetical protein [Peteryoungia ipomoeae]THV21333.1 hypothetical protein FAA97_15020 [Peteryoungia ipomoeae]
MSRIDQLVERVRELSPEEFETFANSIEALRSERWDQQIAQDSASGKLDKTLEEALAAHSKGQSRPL